MGQNFGGEVTILFYYDYQEWYYKHKLWKQLSIFGGIQERFCD